MSSPINTVTVKCPTCKRPVAWLPENEFKPFCCARCRLIDLGEWIMEEKRIPGEAIDLDIDDNEDHFFQ